MKFFSLRLESLHVFGSNKRCSYQFKISSLIPTKQLIVEENSGKYVTFYLRQTTFTELLYELCRHDKQVVRSVYIPYIRYR